MLYLRKIGLRNMPILYSVGNAKLYVTNTLQISPLKPLPVDLCPVPPVALTTESSHLENELETILLYKGLRWNTPLLR